jgi:hypothetical protein
MTSNFGVLAAIAAMLLKSSNAYASPTAQEKIASRKYLLGTWICEHTVGTFSGAYTTTYAEVLDGLWLKQTYDFPPLQTETAVHAEALMGYDGMRDAWVRFFANSKGQYFAIRMTEAGDGGWAWKYVSFFIRKSPETPGSDATFTKKSDSEYVIDGPTYKENGTGPSVTEHHVCKK